jgi:hypothetical protein
VYVIEITASDKLAITEYQCFIVWQASSSSITTMRLNSGTYQEKGNGDYELKRSNFFFKIKSHSII